MLWCEPSSFGESGCRDVCLFSKIMELTVALGLWWSKEEKNKKHLKVKTNVSVAHLFIAQLFNIIHKPCYEQFHTEPLFSFCVTTQREVFIYWWIRDMLTKITDLSAYVTAQLCHWCLHPTLSGAHVCHSWVVVVSSSCQKSKSQ